MARWLLVAMTAGFLVAGQSFSSPLTASAAPSGGTISTYAGGNGTGPATAVPQTPAGLAVAGSILYISDRQASVIRRLDLTTHEQTIYAGTGSTASTGDNGPATAAAIGIPEGIALDAAGNLYIATVDRIRMVDHLTQTITTVAGGGSGPLGDGGTAKSATLYAGWVAIDPTNGDVVISDTGQNRIRRVHNGTINTIAGTGVGGYNNDGAGTSTEVYGPEGLWFDASGNLFFADTSNDLIRELKTNGSVVTIGGSAGQSNQPCPSGTALALGSIIDAPYGIWGDGSGAIYVGAAGGCVEKISGGNLSTVVGCVNTPCTTGGSAPLSTHLYADEGVILDATGNLFIADTGNLEVQELAAGQSTVQTIAGTGAQCGRNTGITATTAYLCDPEGLAVDSAGNLYIAERQAYVVEKVTPGGVISTVAGNWTHGNSGDGGQATAAQLWGPMAVAVDSNGNLYIADAFNYNIRKVTPSGVISTLSNAVPDAEALAIDSTGTYLYAVDSQDNKVFRVAASNGTTTVFAGSGAAGFSGDGGPATSAALFVPHGVGVDAAGNVYINDALNERIRKVDTSGIITTIAVPAHVSQIESPGGQLAVGPAGQIVVVGAYNPSVLLIGPDGIVTTLAGSTTAGFSGDGGPASSALLNWPAGAAFDSAGNLYISDWGNHRIRTIQSYGATAVPTSVIASAGFDSAQVRWTAPVNNTGLPVIAYTVTPYVGATAQAPILVTGKPAATSTVVSGLTPGTQYTFTVTASNGWMPSAASAPSAAITVLAHPVLGSIITWAGTPGVGRALGVAQAPYSLAFAGSDVFVGDVGTAVLRDVNVYSGQETVIAGNGGVGYKGDGGPAVASMLSAASAVAYCGGNLYFADSANYVIRMIDGAGNITAVAGNGSPGYWGDGGPARSAAIGLVLGLACRTGGGLYISDSTNGVVRILNPDGTIRTWWRGFSLPTGIVELGSVDDVAVADSGADNIIVELTDGAAYLLGGTPGVAGFADGNVVDPMTGAYGTKLNDPRGVTYNPGSGGEVYVADRGNNRIREVQITYHDVTTPAGNGTAGFNGDGYGPNTELNRPTDVSMSGSLVYFADSGNFRVRVINLSGGPNVTTIAGNGLPSDSGDGGSSMQAQVGVPYAVAVDAAGNQYVADSQDNVIRKIDTSGNISTVAGNGTLGFVDNVPATSGELNDPRGVAVASNGDLYISDTGNQRVRKVDHTSGQISTVAGNGTAGLLGDGGPAVSAELNYPRAVAVDGAGNVYIADTLNNRVREIVSGTITTVAGNGTQGFAGDGGSATSAQLNLPRGVVLDAAGDLYISDTGNNRVRKVDLSGNITTVAGNGTAGSTGDGGQAKNAELDFPFGLAFDPAGNLYIADTANSRVRLVSKATGVISTVVGTCGPGFSGDWGPASIAQINAPFGLGVDGKGTIYIADSSNNRVRTVYGLDAVRGSPCQAPPASSGSRAATRSNSSTGLLQREMLSAPTAPRGALWGDLPAQPVAPSLHLAGPAPAHHASAPPPARPAPPRTGNGSVAGPPARAAHGLAGAIAHDQPPAATTSATPAGLVWIWPSAAAVIVVALLATWLWWRRRRSPAR